MLVLLESDRIEAFHSYNFLIVGYLHHQQLHVETSVGTFSLGTTQSSIARRIGGFDLLDAEAPAEGKRGRVSLLEVSFRDATRGKARRMYLGAAELRLYLPYGMIHMRC
jgi:hypothetical protein